MSIKRVYVRVCLSCGIEVPHGSPCDSCGGTNFNVIVKFKEVKLSNEKPNIFRKKTKKTVLFPPGK